MLTDADRASLRRTFPRAVLFDIAKEVAAETGLDAYAIMGRSQSADISHARHVTWFIARRDYGWSLTQIAKAAKRDHTTILHGIKREEARRAGG